MTKTGFIGGARRYRLASGTDRVDFWVTYECSIITTQRPVRVRTSDGNDQLYTKAEGREAWREYIAKGYR